MADTYDVIRDALQIKIKIDTPGEILNFAVSVFQPVAGSGVFEKPSCVLDYVFQSPFLDRDVGLEFLNKDEYKPMKIWDHGDFGELLQRYEEKSEFIDKYRDKRSKWKSYLNADEFSTNDVIRDIRQIKKTGDILMYMLSAYQSSAGLGVSEKPLSVLDNVFQSPFLDNEVGNSFFRKTKYHKEKLWAHTTFGELLRRNYSREEFFSEYMDKRKHWSGCTKNEKHLCRSQEHTNKSASSTFNNSKIKYNKSKLDNVDISSDKGNSSTAAESPGQSSVEKYRLMLKNGIPLDCVRHKMQFDKASDKVIKEVDPSYTPAADTSTADTPTLTEKARILNGYPENVRAAVCGSSKKEDTVSIDCVKVTDATKISISVWSTTQKNRHKLSEDESSEMESLFLKKTVTEVHDTSTSGTNKKNSSNLANKKKSSNLSKLITHQRSMNIWITLSKFKEFSLEELALKIIGDIDPFQQIGCVERVDLLKSLLPKSEESVAVHRYIGPEDKLHPAEIFFKYLLKVRRVESKITALQTTYTYFETSSHLLHQYSTVEHACDYVVKSDELVEILEVVLEAVNTLNKGTDNGDAEALHIDVLPKLAQTKSADGTTVVLDYLVEYLVQKSKRHVVEQLVDDLHENCCVASNYLLSDMEKKITKLERSLPRCRDELTEMKRDQGTEGKKKQSLTKDANKESNNNSSATASSASIATANAFAANPREGLLAAIEARRTSTKTTSKGSTAAIHNFEYTPGVKRLETFICSAESKLEEIKLHKAKTSEACTKMLAHFCEDSEDVGKKTKSILQELVKFGNDLHNCLQKYDKKEFARLRKEAFLEKQKKKKELDNSTFANDKVQNTNLNANTTKKHSDNKGNNTILPSSYSFSST